MPASASSYEILRQINEIAAVTSNPQFIAMVREIEQAPDKERLQVARRLATVKELRARGVPVPDDLRLTLRYFEPRPDGSLANEVVTEHASPLRGGGPERLKVNICASVGVVVCASAGCEVHVPYTGPD